MQHRAWSRRLEASHLGRMGRPALLYITCLLISCLVVLAAWGRIAGDEGSVGATEQHPAPASSAQGVPLVGMPVYKFYWVGNSTIPGAGLGVFARRNMPAGTMWNPEDSNPESTLAIRLPLWQSLVGVVEYLKGAGNSSHPLTALWTFFDIYGYICRDHFIVALTGNTFTNHAPEKQQPSGPWKSSASNSRITTGSPQQLQGAGSSAARYANSGDIPPKSRWAQGLSPWQYCTTSITLRDIQAGEEMLEDYFQYTPPCQGRSDCPEFMQQQQQQADLDDGEHPLEEWNRVAMVQLRDAYVANSSSPKGGLGVFAARDLPVGTVWNKEDAMHSLAITRGQWAMMLRLEESLRAARVSKPLISALVNAFRSHAYYCPLDDRMYMPFTHSSLATRRPYSGGGSGSGTASGTRQTQLNLEQQHLANSVHMSVQDLGQAAGNAAAANLHAARCTWLYTVAAIRKGEEILVANNQQHDCDWPGLE